MILYFRFTLTWKILLVPLYLLFAATVGLGIGLWLATFAVRYRDVRNLANYGLQVMKFVTPVVYSASLVSEEWQFLYRLNPMFWVVEGFRWMFLGTGDGPTSMIMISILFTILLLITGIFVFRRTERTIVDWL